MRGWLLALCLLGVSACSSGGGTASPERSVAETITVSSPAFSAGAAIPARFTCHGADRSPPLRWSAPPAGTAELALVVDDPDAPGGTYVHWVVIHLAPTRTELAEGALPPEAGQLPGSGGKASYAGPCPPAGPVHHYRFTVYALPRRVDAGGNPAPGEAVARIEQAASARGRLVGTFGR